MSATLTVIDPRLDPEAVRMPTPSLTEFPGSPSKPVLTNATSSGMMLHWEKPMRIGGSQLKGYQVGMRAQTHLLANSFFHLLLVFVSSVACTLYSLTDLHHRGKAPKLFQRGSG